MMEKVCEYCYKYRCPPTCPSYEGRSPQRGKPVGVCRKCGCYIYEDDEYRRIGRGILCHECGVLGKIGGSYGRK